MRALALLMATVVSASAQTWVTRTQCISNCDIPASNGNQNYSPEGGPSIAWGGMSSRATERIKECGTNPLCMLARAAVGYPIALLFDGPYYAVKGVGYGLYYTSVGIGKAGKAIGRGIAYPFRDRPQPPPGNWEAYKRQVLRMQKKLAKRDKASRENAKWCKGHVPLSHGPSRVEWESRCNPGDIISRMFLPADVRFPNAGEASPMGLSKDIADSTTHATDAVQQEALAKAGLTAPVAAAAPAVAAGIMVPNPAEAEALPTSPPPSSPVTSGADSHPAASPAAAPAAPAASQAPASPPIAESAAVPPAGGTGIPAALPASARLEQRDAAEVLKQGDEPIKDAAHGGFDAREPMLGSKQKEVLTAFNATATQGPRNPPDFQAAIAAMGRGETSDPAFDGTNAHVPGVAAPSFGAAPTSAPPETGASGNPPVALHALVAAGKARLIGNPDRYQNSFVYQHGATCVQIMARQFLGDEGISMTEDELFYKILEYGLWKTPKLCPKNRTPQKLCNIKYDPANKLCYLISDDKSQKGPLTPGLCELARKEGTTFEVAIPALVNEYSKRKYIGFSIDPPAGTPRAEIRKRKKDELDKARKELLAALKSGRNVAIGTLGGTLWDNDSEEFHIVAVTAAVENLNGTIEGYYVNDGTGHYGRFVPRVLFENAWRDDLVFRIYSQ